MNLDELQSVQSKERQSDSLQQLRASFYEDAGAYIQSLRDERAAAAERAADPLDSPEVARLSDDISTAEQTVEALYERRVGKVVKMASLAAAEMPIEQEGLTKEERELFDTLVTAIEENRDAVLDVVSGSTSAAGGVDQTRTDTDVGDSPTPDETVDQGPQSSADTDSTPADVDAATLMGDPATAEAAADTEPPIPPEEPPNDAAAPADQDSEHTERTGDQATADQGDAAADIDRTTVRITSDVGAIFGVDEREYDLATDDIVTLPTANAEPLIDRDVAERCE
jgi:DNA replication factor GINS